MAQCCWTVTVLDCHDTCWTVCGRTSSKSAKQNPLTVTVHVVQADCAGLQVGNE
jgi:hypothetical protein